MNIHITTAPKPPRKTRGELAKLVDADYYGYRDEDDGVIVPLEQEEEKKGQTYFQGNIVTPEWCSVVCSYNGGDSIDVVCVCVCMERKTTSDMQCAS